MYVIRKRKGKRASRALYTDDQNGGEQAQQGEDYIAATAQVWDRETRIRDSFPRYLAHVVAMMTAKALWSRKDSTSSRGAMLCHPGWAFGSSICLRYPTLGLQETA